MYKQYSDNSQLLRLSGRRGLRRCGWLAPRALPSAIWIKASPSRIESSDTFKSTGVISTFFTFFELKIKFIFVAITKDEPSEYFKNFQIIVIRLKIGTTNDFMFKNL